MAIEQKYVIKVGSVSVTCLFVGGVFQGWDNLSPYLALSITVLFCSGYYLLVTSVWRAYELFTVEDPEDLEVIFVKFLQ